MEKLLFVSAQPDLPYFHWQTKLYVHNFIEKGINPKQIQILFSITQENGEPTDGGIDLIKTGVNVNFYKDERVRKHYIPSIKPYLIYKWLEQNPQKGKIFFLHDSDIILNQPLKLSNLIEDDVIYMSDTKSYIGYDYLKKSSSNYEKEFNGCQNEQLINEMCEVVGINKQKLIDNQENSGGGQYIIKNTDSEFWKKVFEDSNNLYSKMMTFQRRFPLRNGKVQFWTAEMWSLLWNLWKSGKQTKIVKELDFCWATDHIKKTTETPILHMAGVTENMKYNKFYKGEYIEKNPIELLMKNPDYFNYVDISNATKHYIDNMRSYIKKTI